MIRAEREVTVMNGLSRSQFIVWMIAFLSFPIGGLLVLLLLGSIDNPLEALVGGLVAGAVIGFGQMLALRRRVKVGFEWVGATAVGMGIGVGLSAALIGTETTVEAILLRAVVTGLLIGIGQAWVLRKFSRRALWWIPAVAVLYAVGWFVTAQVINTSVDQGFVVFGSSGALAYQALTGLVLLVLFSPRES